jgi:hypothetical protein
VNVAMKGYGVPAAASALPIRVGVGAIELQLRGDFTPARSLFASSRRRHPRDLLFGTVLGS